MAGEEKVEVKKGEEKVESKKIELDPEQYSALLDRIAELEAGAATKHNREEEEEIDDIESLAREGKKGKVKEVEEEEETEVSLDEMTNTQLAQFIVQTVNEQIGGKINALEVATETSRVLREIDKAERDHEDFWQYEDIIRKLSIDNPSLAIEDAYLLAKSKSPAKKGNGKGEKEEVSQTRTERLLKLPSRKVLGEKPGIAVGSSEEKTSGTNTKKAAEKAWKDIMGDKTII